MTVKQLVQRLVKRVQRRSNLIGVDKQVFLKPRFCALKPSDVLG